MKDRTHSKAYANAEAQTLTPIQAHAFTHTHTHADTDPHGEIRAGISHAATMPISSLYLIEEAVKGS